MELDGRLQGASWRWPLLVSVVLLNICLPSLVLSYGVLLIHLVNYEVPIWLGLSTPTIFILTYSLTQCWCREAADSWGGSTGYRVMASLGLAAVVTSLFVSGLIPYHWQPLVYGILGGFGSSLMSAQVDAVVFDTYDTRLGLVRGLCFAGQAVGQSLFPHIITALINNYDYSYACIVISGIMLQMLPAILLLKVEDSIRRPVSFSRYSDLAKTYAIFSNENLDNYYTTEVQLQNMDKKSWKSPSDDNLYRENDVKYEENIYENDINATITPPPSPEEKRRNIFGVEILPEIPEESESEDDDYNAAAGNSMNNKLKRFSVAIKRLSTLGDNLDDCISNQYRKDSQSDRGSDNRELTEVEVTYENISPVTDMQREKIFNSFSFKCQSAYASMRRRMWMPSYRVYRMKRRMSYIMFSVNDTFMKPLTRSLSCWRFYPSLLLAFTKLSLTAVFLPLLPLIATGKHLRISMTETNFLLTLYAFTWICFLLCTPWLMQTRKTNFKYIAFLGLVISTAACFILAEADNHDMFSIGVVVAGLGYGAISSCWETTIQDFVGARKWPKIHSPLETLAGCLLASFVLGISFVIDTEGGLQLVMFILGVILFGITIIWTLLLAISIYVTKFGSKRLERH